MSTATPLLIELTGDFAKSHAARSIPGAVWDADRHKWIVADPIPRTAAIILRIFPELAATYPELAERRDLLAQDVRPFDNATPAELYIEEECGQEWSVNLAEQGVDMYGFQSLDLGYVHAVLEKHGGAYIGWERGLGKTLGSCALIEATDARRTLVVCPNTAKESVWAAEVARWLPDHEVKVLPNDKTKRDRMLEWVKYTDRYEDDCPMVLVIHYEALSIIAGKKKVGRNTQIQRGWDKYGEWDLVIADEAHRIKDPKAQMSKALKKVPARYKLALSGSIIQNHAEELFSVLQWLFPDTYKRKWQDWNDRYLDYDEGPFGKICLGIKIERLEDLRQELGVFMVYRRKEDELDLPEKTEQTLLVDLSAPQRQAYDELLTTCLTELDDGSRIKAADGLVMLGKLRQIASGLDLVGSEVRDSSKLDLAVELISDAEDEAFVVFTWYKANGHTLQDRLAVRGIESFVVDGEVPHDSRAAAIAAFQAGERRVFIGTLATLAESVTLHRATNAIFIDRSWNPAQNVQAEDRIYRIGQDRPVTITHIVAKNTVDELRVLPVIANKEALRRLILGGK